MILRLLYLIVLLYLFFISISLMGVAFKFFGKGFAETLLQTTASPVIGLFIGILATSIVQSSSTTTSITVGIVAVGGLQIEGAIPIIMGANIGTTITNTLVTTAHIYRPDEMRRAFAVSTVHDWFNLLAVIVLFPLQVTTNFIGISASYLATIFSNVGGLELFNPLQIIIKPSIDLIVNVVGKSGILLLILSLVVLFIALRYIVINLKTLVIGRVEIFFDQILFKTSARALVIGLILTVLVQSSSITTSLAVPLAGAGILTIQQIYPYTLGANIGTTITAMLAAMVTGQIAAVTVAFSHFIFNVFGIFIFLPLKMIPIFFAEKLAEYSLRSKLIPIAYILLVFFLFPLLLIYFLE
ncbi:MAG: Na/Pi symporter [Bacteroidota bacterium]|nr:Na/Pi symporter [Bacteroidota bacterium]